MSEIKEKLNKIILKAETNQINDSASMIPDSITFKNLVK